MTIVATTVKIQLFGAFRSYGNGRELEIEMTSPCSLLELKNRIGDHFGSTLNLRGLLHESAFGSASEILQDEAVIFPGQTVALLPPVCGG